VNSAILFTINLLRCSRQWKYAQNRGEGVVFVYSLGRGGKRLDRGGPYEDCALPQGYFLQTETALYCGFTCFGWRLAADAIGYFAAAGSVHAG